MINTDDAKVLINLARSAIEKALKGKNIDVPQWVREKYSQPAGVFVTLKKGGRLRGCIGLPYPVLPLWKATVHAALGAAFEDPRFPPLQSEEELNNTTFEITILTPPRELKVEDKRLLPQLIKVGRDGLIVEAMGRSGLLLPQVPIEQGWDSVTFLAHTCLKAGLPPDCWLWDKTKVKTFQGLVFEELSPRGEVVKRESA
ncbi:MAG TPA: TIGR00296 family protein [Aquifex aeolicus]|nr:TIGR00296 family protein [Aquificales bacterium]HIQ26086.1 TIGR00296 family protein [Aquifex aeolicus]